jgi:quinol monooxygenase YgiN
MYSSTPPERPSHFETFTPRYRDSCLGSILRVIFIVVKFPVKPEFADIWIEKVTPFTEATRAEPGNLWFEWSRSVEDPNTFVLCEAFADDGAAAHVGSTHFKEGLATMRPMVSRTPEIVSTSIDGQDGWSAMGELQID